MLYKIYLICKNIDAGRVKPANQTRRKKHMKKQTKKAAAKAATNPKGLKKIISDYEANVMIAEELVSIIETGDYSRWTKNWHYLEDLTDLYYYVIDGKGAANVFTTELLTYVNTLVNDIPAGFYAEMRQIKARGLHLAKGAKGIPSYQLRFFYKELTAAEENYIKEDEELSVLLENLIRNHDEQFKASFDYINEKGQQRHFDEVILWDNYKNQPAYQRAQYVLIYLFNINDIKEGVDVKKYWQVGDRKPSISEEQRLTNIEAVKKSYIQRGKIRFEEVEQGRAFYTPAYHKVTMPLFTQFEKPEDYYQTLFHEFSHSTGHYSLLNRKSLTAACGFRSKTYAKEELVAELSSLFILDNLKLITEDLFKNTAAYLASWGSQLAKSIKYSILNTLNNALKAAELVLNKTLKSKKKLDKKEVVTTTTTTTSEEATAASSKVEEVKVSEPVEETGEIGAKIDAANVAALQEKFAVRDNTIKRDYTKKEMIRKALNFHKKTTKSITKQQLKKAVIIDDKQVICNSAYLVMLDSDHVVPMETIKSFEEAKEEGYPVLTTVIKSTIDNKRLDVAKNIKALDVRQANRNKENHIAVSVSDKIAFWPEIFEAVLNFMQVKNSDKVTIFWQSGENRKPCMIMANGQKAILCPIMWNEDWNSEEEKPQYNPEEELKEENPVKTLQQLGASSGMAVFMTATQQDSKRYKVEWAHYRFGEESKGEDYIVNVEHNETEVFTSLDKAMAAYKAIKRNSHYKGYRRWIQISVSSDEGKTYTGSYFHDTF